MPCSVTSIGDSAFQECTNMTKVLIPGSVTSIGENAFDWCSSLTNVMIANGVTSIGEQAFSGCSSLTNITIPASVTSIGQGAFTGCTNLTAIAVEAQNSFYSSTNGVLFDKSQTTIVEYPGGINGSYTIPNSVTSIGDMAFLGCSSLTTVTIPDSVASIGNMAFCGCTSLSSVTIGSGLGSFLDGAFFYCTNLNSVYFKGNAPTADSTALGSDSNATVYYLAGTVGWSGFSSSTAVPIVLWNPLIQTGAASFGVKNDHFGFNITGTNNFTVVVEACTNLASPVWTPVTNVTLTNGSFYFSDPQWTNYPSRYYSLQMP